MVWSSGCSPNLVEAPLRKQRAMAAARRCFVRALDTAGRIPAQVTTDGHEAYPRASREAVGERAHHRTSRDKNTRIAPDHRGSKQRSCPLRGFGNFAAAGRFCSAFEEQRQYLRAPARSGASVALAGRRRRCHERRAGIIAAPAAA